MEDIRPDLASQHLALLRAILGFRRRLRKGSYRYLYILLTRLRNGDRQLLSASPMCVLVCSLCMILNVPSSWNLGTSALGATVISFWSRNDLASLPGFPLLYADLHSPTSQPSHPGSSHLVPSGTQRMVPHHHTRYPIP
jgi:hypothetical protein